MTFRNHLCLLILFKMTTLGVAVLTVVVCSPHVLLLQNCFPGSVQSKKESCLSQNQYFLKLPFTLHASPGFKSQSHHRDLCLNYLAVFQNPNLPSIEESWLLLKLMERVHHWIWSSSSVKPIKIFYIWWHTEYVYNFALIDVMCQLD